MSGALITRVNRSWGKAQANITAAVFFWDMLNFFNDHPSMVCRGYGTGKSQTGDTTLPAAWTGWDPTTEAVPATMGDNSWVVFEAVDASELLLGTGTFPWQVKLQYTLVSGFDDCNVADIDYSEETTTYCVAMRCSPMGGWDSIACDFAPNGGEDISDNYLIYLNQDENYYLDIIGDDDVVFWKGAAFDTTEAPVQSRGGYLGMFQRRSSAITYPFIFFTGVIEDFPASSGRRAINSRNTGSVSYQWRYTDGTMSWPSFSLWADGTKVETHHIHTWNHILIPHVTPDQATGDDLVMAVMLAQREPPAKHAIVGELLLLSATGTTYGQHVVFGPTAQRWIQFGYDPSTYAGIAMRWPAGAVPIW